MAPYAWGSVSFAGLIGILGVAAVSKDFLKSDLNFFRSVSLVLMRGKISVSKGIKVHDIGKKGAVERGSIGFGEDLMADTETA